MKQSIYKITKMDCPSEEQMIRMKLEGITQISALHFDIPNRILKVFHKETAEEITQKLLELNLDTSLQSTNKANKEDIIIEDTSQEHRLLWKVLIINFVFFVLEIVTGFFANSMGLVADSLDMLADSLVYALALFAVGSAVAFKKKIAKISGYFQLILALLGLLEVVRRFIGLEEFPHFQTMIIISFLALIGNSLCLYLLQKSKSQEAHMKASMIFTSNDIIINLGVILAGISVYLSQSKYPDLIIGIIVFFIVGKGAISILRLAK